MFNHDCPDEPVAIKPSKYSQGKYQGNGYHKEYGDFRHNSHGSHCESAEGLNPTEEDGQFRTPGHMRESMSSFTGRPGIKGRNETIRMTMLCAVYFGITFTWGVEMTYCTPYLLNLGLTKSQTSLVWIAGPLSGIITQPVVGVLADSNRSKWGRRRPYIVVGTAIVAAALLTLGWTKEIVSALLPADSEFSRTLTIFVAVLALYVTDFAINAVMSCSRSLLVDTLPVSKQQAGAAWAGRIGSLGHIFGYAIGAVDLPTTLGPRLGDTQFKQLTMIAALSMLATAATTCWAVTERVLISVRHDPREATAGRFKVFRQIWSTLLNLPPRIQIICWSMFWAWIGWFPFHFYGSTWVGETYFRYDVPDEVRDSSDVLGQMGRIGSYTLTIYSCMTFLGAWLLPLLVRAPEEDKFTHRPPQSIAHLVEGFNKVKPDLLTVWQAGHVMFACAMFLAPFARSFRVATALVVFCGMPWSIISWAPTATMGMEVNKLTNHDTSYRRLSGGPDSIEMRTALGNPADAIHIVEHGPDDSTTGSGSTGELSGIYFGILNIYQTVPQFIGSFISTVVFSVLEPGKSPELATDAHPSEHHPTDGPNAISVCLFIGAIAACAALVVTRKLRHTP